MYEHICIYIHIYTYMYMCVYICMYMYIHIYIDSPSYSNPVEADKVHAKTPMHMYLYILDLDTKHIQRRCVVYSVRSAYTQSKQGSS